MSQKYHFEQDTEAEAVEELFLKLKLLGFSVDKTRDGWIVLRFRKDSLDWTFAYAGKTASARLPRKWFRFVGPEESVALELQPSLATLTQDENDDETDSLLEGRTEFFD